MVRQEKGKERLIDGILAVVITLESGVGVEADIFL